MLRNKYGLQAGAARMGEHLARMREQQKRATEASSKQESRELAARFSTEARAAEIQLRPVMDDRWWENARHDRVAAMYHTAAAWRAHSLVAHDAAVHMTDQIRRATESTSAPATQRRWRSASTAASPHETRPPTPSVVQRARIEHTITDASPTLTAPPRRATTRRPAGR